MKQVTDHIYMLRDAQDSNAYLVVGEERALVIDTMFGNESIKDTVRQVTDLPLTLIHTHGHCDHIGGDGEFGEAYIDAKDLDVAKEHWRMIQEERAKQNAEVEGDIQWKVFVPGKTIDLGGYTLETYEVPGHTPGGLCFLNRQERVFITGDAINEHIWMHLPESQPLEVLIQSLQALSPIRDAFDVMLNGHAPEAVPVSVIDELMRTAQEVLDGKTEEDLDYPCFGEMYKAHRFYPGDDGHVVVYNL